MSSIRHHDHRRPFDAMLAEDVKSRLSDQGFTVLTGGMMTRGFGHN